MNRLDYEREIFGMLFKTSNGLQVYLDDLLRSTGLTSKQMFLMIVISSFDCDPTLKEVAEKSSSSYQNVKQLALKLEKENYVEIKTDEKDRRKKQLILTDKALSFWAKRDQSDLQKMDQLFTGCSDEDLKTFLKVMVQLQSNIEEM